VHDVLALLHVLLLQVLFIGYIVPWPWNANFSVMFPLFSRTSAL